MLESLEQEYRRDEDWCGSHDKLGTSTDSDHLLPLISKHLEQKEAFLKVRRKFSEGLFQTHIGDTTANSVKGHGKKITFGKRPR